GDGGGQPSTVVDRRLVDDSARLRHVIALLPGIELAIAAQIAAAVVELAARVAAHLAASAVALLAGDIVTVALLARRKIDDPVPAHGTLIGVVDDRAAHRVAGRDPPGAGRPQARRGEAVLVRR